MFVCLFVCLPRKHLRVLMNSLKRVRAFQIELEFGSVGFFKERGSIGVPEEKPLGGRERTNNKLNPDMSCTVQQDSNRATMVAGGAATTASPLFPMRDIKW